ncbi:hypothetical protein EDD16DRAFT_1635908 [Pisolithus croceorrhizus]|nr:hypothetical protein EDD16DRAFT_1635908 [Pisolithus croceorrhizus]
MAGGGGWMLTMFTASLLHLVCEWSHGRWWWMDADHGVSGVMAGGGGWMLTMFTASLLHLVSREVSGVMAGGGGCMLTMFTASLLHLGS